ncbi:PPC domain-containing DNA-binding protein [Endozoicomonas arenosclerae]|uniref:PPC domain-containing DNA-binding protein n=1 Tax=Endozoicomonas arenosclerae TaxID=1633495 RepID=UPI000784D472|nr:PPC domain-containing DNA-binding protein [Endozoicomonas arenosclerae]
MKTHSQRLLPGDDLYLKLQNLAQEWSAACVLTCVGSLKVLSVRLAGAEHEKRLNGPFEILSLSGTCCSTGLHLHISVADREGRVLGGHLKSGSIIDTTAEIVIALLENTCFTRTMDSETGYLELEVKKVSQASS